MGLTVTEIGQKIGAPREVVNLLLAQKGLQEGGPGAYSPTDLGAQFSSIQDRDNGYGGWAYRAWSWIKWDPKVIDELDVTAEKIAEMTEELRLAKAAKRAADKLASEEYWAEVAAKQAEKLTTVNDSKNGLTSGQKVAIVVGVAAVVTVTVVGGVVVHRLVKRRRERKSARSE